ncbi:hypothetical protein MNV49_001535 [Pseudohyphozyma bogoriensis]|nr:hypothetical protein MNV49_001535 [Pseudohyphozyma bogoriensis]
MLYRDVLLDWTSPGPGFDIVSPWTAGTTAPQTWIAQTELRQHTRSLTIHVAADCLPSEYDALDPFMEELQAHSKLLTRLAILVDGPTPVHIPSLRCVGFENLKELYFDGHVSIELPTRSPLSFALTHLTFTKMTQPSDYTYALLMQASRHSLRHLSIALPMDRSAFYKLTIHHLPLVMRNLTHLTLCGAILNVSALLPSFPPELGDALKLGGHLEELIVDFEHSSVASQESPLVDIIKSLPETAPLHTLKTSSYFQTQAVLAQIQQLRQLDRLKLVRSRVGSYGTWSYPTLSKEVVAQCAKRRLEVISVDPFGEERHVAPPLLTQPTPRWMLSTDPVAPVNYGRSAYPRVDPPRPNRVTSAFPTSTTATRGRRYTYVNV